MKKISGTIYDRSPKAIFILGIVFIIFLIVLIISTVVSIQNKIKQGRHIGQDLTVKNTITVFGTGEIYTKPDLFLTTFSVRNEAKTVIEAMAENAEKMNAVIAFMKIQGIEDKDLKTTSFNIHPRYEWRKAEIEIWPQTEGKRVLVGYEVVQSLQVKIRVLEKIGDIIQGATDAGANHVGSLQFTIDDRDEFEKQAKEQAIEEAKEKAGELADQLGIKLIRIVNFSEGRAIPRLPYYDFAQRKEVVSLEAAPPQIEIGENKIQVSVSITFEIE